MNEFQIECLLCDSQIQACAEAGMITPFVPRQMREKNGEECVSYGLSSYGYDVRLANEFVIFTDAEGVVVDPKHPENFERFTMRKIGEYVDIPPHGFVLGRSVEYFKMPSNVLGDVRGKSTYGRCGSSCTIPLLEPGWEGHITLGFANHTPLWQRLYSNEGCAQVVFFRGKQCDTTYASRRGKYQGQVGVTLPRC